MEKIDLKSGALILRPLESMDLDHFLQLSSQTCGSLHRKQNQAELDLLARFQSFVREFAFRQESEVWVAITPTKDYAGHLWLQEATNRFNGIKELWVWDLSVMPEFRKQGLGRELMEHAKARAVERGCLELWLLVAEDNQEAQRLYARMGLSQRARMLSMVL
jgi:ribosomal protein S18 acetylase RimI-like enzyme